MKCKCGNEINVKMAAKLACKGGRILTSMTTIISVECEKCREKFQLPISSSEYVIKEK
jgi:hypothetical protein